MLYNRTRLPLEDSYAEKTDFPPETRDAACQDVFTDDGRFYCLRDLL